jgi:hypothetical protein
MEQEEVIIKFKILNKPAIIIKREGIAIGKIIVSWNEIKDYSVVKTKGKEFILLFVDEPRRFLDEANWLAKWWMKLNMTQYKTPIRIPIIYLRASLDELKNAILDGMKNHALSKRDK